MLFIHKVMVFEWVINAVARSSGAGVSSRGMRLECTPVQIASRLSPRTVLDNNEPSTGS